MLGPTEAGLSFIVSWAVGESDPANIVLLGIVYYKLRENHNDLQAELMKIEERMKDLDDLQNGDK